MTTTRAKFKVASVEHTEYARNVLMRPVSGASEENKSFVAATPSGELKMQVSLACAAEFKPGQEFYLDFTPVEG
jgi:hypothetical protein